MSFNKRHYFAHLSNVCQKHDISRSDVYVVSGGAMVFYGLREITGDIDVLVPSYVFDKLIHSTGLESKHLPPLGDNPGVEILVVDGVDFHRDKNFNTRSFKIHKGFLIQTKQDLLLFKMNMGRAKDLEDIKALESCWKELNSVETVRLNKLLENHHVDV